MDQEIQLRNGISRAALLYVESAVISDIKDEGNDVIICLSILKSKKMMRVANGVVDRATQLSCALRDVHPRLTRVEVKYIDCLPDLSKYMDSLGIFGKNRDFMKSQISQFKELNRSFGFI